MASMLMTRRRWRAALVRLHRWFGLGAAVFLLLVALTGSLLAWREEIELLLTPELMLADDGSQAALHPLTLQHIVQAHYPHALAAAVPLSAKPGRSMLFNLRSRIDPDSGKPYVLNADQVFVDPSNGRILGERRFADLSQGWKNLMPFVYRLHYSLWLGVVGKLLLGLVALLWVLDCFNGAYLTLPQASSGKPANRGISWWRRWRPAWLVRWQAGGHRRNFDLHRASGLWPWLLLLPLAWSSVALNLPEVYRPLMQIWLPHQPDEHSIIHAFPPPPPPPAHSMPWPDALIRARQLMAEQQKTGGFRVLREEKLVLDSDHGVYRYEVYSDREIRTWRGTTRLYFDAASGVLRGVWLPSGSAGGDTVYSWLLALHMAAVGGMPVKLAVTVLGLALALATVTGVLIWWKKRQARLIARARAAPAAAAGEA